MKSLQVENFSPALYNTNNLCDTYSSTTFRRRCVKYGQMEQSRHILTSWISMCMFLCFYSAGFSTYKAKTLLFILIVTAAPLTCHATIPFEWVHKYISVYGQWWKCHHFCWSICTTSWKRATLLFACLPAMLHRGLIRGVDRSCNLKRGHCSSEQKQLKENERRPPRVKNRKLSTCMLESTTSPPQLPHRHPPSPTPPQTYWACIVMYDQICQFFL